MGVGADADTQMLVNARQFEVTDDDLLLTQSGGQLCRVMLWMAGEDEVLVIINTANEAKTTKKGSKFKNYGKILTGKDDNKQ